MVKVLIIEDDSSARLVTKLHLRNEYQVVEASDGMEAMELLKHQSVDLIIADVMMPKMNGYEFVEQFRMMDKNTPVLFLTAKKEWQDKKMGFAIGIDDYMTKPVNYEELQWRIRALFRRAKISNPGVPGAGHGLHRLLAYLQIPSPEAQADQGEGLFIPVHRVPPVLPPWRHRPPGGLPC